MTIETLDKVKNQIDRIENIEGCTTINIIGGEPTLDMDKFTRLMDYMSRWDNVRFEMTTNGQWLEKVETIRQFMKAVRPFVGSDGCFDDGISVRISNDDYHDEFRPDWLKSDKLKHVISAMFDYSAMEYWDDGIFVSTAYYCNGCSETFDEYINECPHCKGEDIIEEEGTFHMYPVPYDDSNPWLWVDSHNDYGQMVPIGRARTNGIGGADQAYNGRCYNPGTKLTYRANGALSDICCTGSNCRFGTVDDDP